MATRLAEELETEVRVERLADGAIQPELIAAAPGPPGRADAARGGGPPGARATFSLGRHAHADWQLSLEGPWDHGRHGVWFAGIVAALDAALEGPALRHLYERTSDTISAAYAFTRRLSRIADTRRLRQTIVDTMAEAVGARLGALALHDEAAGVLKVVATHGYPQVLVDHVRLRPGEGVLGRVFESRQPLLVPDVRIVPGLHSRRPRYRTASFTAVPLLGNGRVHGVVSVADRRDDRAFDRDDLTVLRALAAPAALALQNDHLLEQTQALAHAATIDPLTSLYNRRYFQTRIDEEMERARRYGLDLALLLIDIDDFKRHNDELGHLAGDHLLRQISDVLRRSVRVFDVCTRYGGEEFAILMPGSGTANSLVVAERIRHRVESSAREGGPLPAHLRITVSLGLAVLGADATPQELVARADRALYRAKGDGKNCVRME
ncbi:MAG: diguanylate cyclase [Vicinamibacteraceae bacterium]|nr:diguanylate cyclase [Vicinamibacteraceae bacterium]